MPKDLEVFHQEENLAQEMWDQDSHKKSEQSAHNKRELS